MSTTIQTSEDRSSKQELKRTLALSQRRMFSIGVAMALGWLLLAVIAVLVLAIWLDLLWELSPAARVAAMIAAVLVGGGLFTALMVSLSRNAVASRLAKRLDEVAGTGGEISTGLQLTEFDRGEAATPSVADHQLRQGLATLAVARAAQTASDVDPKVAIPVRPLKVVACLLAGVLLLLGAIGLTMPKLAWTQWWRFASPAAETPPFSTLDFAVSPGDVEIKYGSPIDISVQLNMPAVDDLQLRIVGETEEIVPMFCESGNRWRALLSRVTEPLEYQVFSGRARSEKYRIQLLRVPEISEVTFRVTPPDYTGAGTMVTGAQEPLRGLPGTKVGVVASSNMPLSGGRLVISHGQQSRTVPLEVTEDQNNEVTGHFVIERGGKYELVLTNLEGTDSLNVVSGSILPTVDERPFVRLTNPKPSSMALATVRLPVTIEAEDDFGISKLSLYRSLNNSRPLPLDIPLRPISDASKVREKRLARQIELPLDQYGLQPGDRMEFFARVEDNNPQLSQGFESSVHVVEIISREMYEKLNREKMGVEAMMARYRQVERQLEDLELTQRELEAMEGLSDDPAEAAKQRKERKQKLAESARSFERTASEMREMLRRHFPVDVDKELDPRIAELAERLVEVAAEIRELNRKLDEYEIDNEELKERLAELREKLEGLREEFDEEVMEPLQQLAGVFELMSKQAEFVQHVLRQRNLADRLQSLDGKDDLQEMSFKRRIREMADEQTTLQVQLNELVEKIGDLAIVLPPGQGLEELKETALEFATKVVNSGAMEEQNEASMALAEMSGSAGFKHASAAADILESLLKDGGEIGEAGQQAGNQIFNPQLGRPGLGNSLDQMMRLFGPRNGSRQVGKNNRGLYGDRPQANKRGGGRGDKQSRGGGGIAQTRPADVEPGNEVQRGGGRTGFSQIKIPLQYERKVSEYYRRLIEELGDDL